MERQQQGLRFSPPPTLIDDADSQAKWYYRLEREYLWARVEGRPFENPVQPPSSGEAEGPKPKVAPQGAIRSFEVSVFFTFGYVVAVRSPARREPSRATPGWQALGPGRRSRQE